MDAAQEVKARLSIEDVISEYVALKRAGKNYKGLSPFTNEKSPSFVVSPEKQIWHDFSSGRGGDVFTFVQEAEGLDFKGALELLARKAGVDLDQYKGTSGSRGGVNKERLFEILDRATKFYQVQLKANKDAYEYVAKKRAFTKETILEFRLGYSPNSGNALLEYLKKIGYLEADIQAAGLLARRSGRSADMFRGRIMIPLADQFGKIVGFTARILADDPSAPKYINTPSTVLYDKSRHIYGLHLAKKAIQKEKFSVLVEGNLDVISSHQAGVSNVVATAGTALTEMQLKVLGRFSPDVRLAFDEDRAGLAATERAIPLASKTGVNLSVVTIPSGKDPDELVRQDPAIWQKVISEQEYALDWLIGIYQKELDLNSAQGKKMFSSAILPVVKRLEDPVEQDHYVTKLAQLLHIETAAVRSSMEQKQVEVAPRQKKPVVSSVEKAPLDTSEYIKIADRILALTFSLPSLRAYLEGVEEGMFITAQARELFVFLKEHPTFDGSGDERALLNTLVDYVKIITLHFEELYSGVEPLELQYEVTRLRTRLVEIYVKDQKKQIVHEMEKAGEDQMGPYLEKVRALDQLLNRTKE